MTQATAAPWLAGTGLPLELDAHGDHGRFDLLDDVGKTNWSLQFTRPLGQVLGERGWIFQAQVQAGSRYESGGAKTRDSCREKDDSTRG